MPEVKRVSANWNMQEFYPSPHGTHVAVEDFDRVTAEREALQQRLNDRDQRVDELMQERGTLRAALSTEVEAGDSWKREAEDLRDQLEACLKALKEAGDYRSAASIEAALSASAEQKCCAPTAEELKLLADGDCTPEELWGIGGKPSCPKCHKAEPSASVTAWDYAAPGAESFTVGAKP
ncbi:MAG: hypothetical protein GAK36_00054 [Pseudomonas sp.]|nr:MAG: hypothetical protein GAK36_00054 [Pseudomonas sp.]